MSSGSNSPICGIVTPAVLDEMAHPSPTLSARLSRCGLLEIRYDLFSDEVAWPSLAAIVRAAAPELELIGTIRLARDGGHFPDSKASTRAAVFCRLAKELDWVDWEAEELESEPGLTSNLNGLGAKLLVSHHDFISAPSFLEMEHVAAEALASRAEGIKFAVFCGADPAELYRFARKFAGRFQRLACFGMGAESSQSRYTSIRHGANLTYAPLANGTLAPGQLSVEQLETGMESFLREMR